eukprot:CAMPEP_0170545102 /NCGR_PEP_ID=MMETSP0211-20121228/3616_1 /TAXON_ID=311385 /ORGANISM="Pseudokeronopsis sp., Strain OXSARD2" /LENGTH=57 /DNA_ID=CAMNT_0010848921 /DNA_START=823 /DNA_END=996 /DNA_ORIENTATION=-
MSTIKRLKQGKSEDEKKKLKEKHTSKDILINLKFLLEEYETITDQLRINEASGKGDQ